MLNLNVTQDNLYLFLPGKTSRVAVFLANKENIRIIDALEKVYKSETYKLLERENSKEWHYGPVAIYEALCEELAK